MKAQYNPYAMKYNFTHFLFFFSPRNSSELVPFRPLELLRFHRIIKRYFNKTRRCTSNNVQSIPPCANRTINGPLLRVQRNAWKLIFAANPLCTLLTALIRARANRVPIPQLFSTIDSISARGTTRQYEERVRPRRNKEVEGEPMCFEADSTNDVEKEYLIVFYVDRLKGYEYFTSRNILKFSQRTKFYV